MGEFPLESSPSRIALAGDWHGNTLAALAAIERAARERAAGVLHLGDFGIWPGLAGRRFLDGIEDALRRHGMWLAFVDGNHEDFVQLEAIPVQPSGTRWVRPGIRHLPRGFRWQWHGKTWLALGGATSLDRLRRRELVDWWPQEAITWPQAERAIAGGQVDFMVTHDAPARADVPGLDPSLWDVGELLVAERHRELLQRIVDAVGPSQLWHGHMHVRYSTTVTTPAGPCRVDGLDCDLGRTQDNIVVVDLDQEQG